MTASKARAAFAAKGADSDSDCARTDQKHETRLRRVIVK
jgi:hypothetical protein